MRNNLKLFAKVMIVVIIVALAILANSCCSLLNCTSTTSTTDTLLVTDTIYRPGEISYKLNDSIIEALSDSLTYYRTYIDTLTGDTIRIPVEYPIYVKYNPVTAETDLATAKAFIENYRLKLILENKDTTVLIRLDSLITTIENKTIIINTYESANNKLLNKLHNTRTAFFTALGVIVFLILFLGFIIKVK